MPPAGSPMSLGTVGVEGDPRQSSPSLGKMFLEWKVRNGAARSVSWSGPRRSRSDPSRLGIAPNRAVRESDPRYTALLRWASADLPDFIPMSVVADSGHELYTI